MVNQSMSLFESFSCAEMPVRLSFGGVLRWPSSGVCKLEKWKNVRFYPVRRMKIRQSVDADVGGNNM